MRVSALKARNQRMVLVLLAIAALLGAGLLAAWALRSEASYFYLPAEILAHPPKPDQEVRLGGMVRRGSLHTLADGVTVAFDVTDGKVRVPVRFTGIVPSLFVEGSGVVAQGHMEAGAAGHDLFVATQLLAKHDEKYVPREMASMSAKEAHDLVEHTQ
ncbi:cytochrome c maturation protein CcmE [Novosphingobium sp. 9]|uniref:cytochrome c maturation protein CcmE n=1 Tax=Novosphingobium sp. 9 TaxID=2025349 RepID=UPI0021B5E77F|nr:cytochrome c maturation protein CcmE [Novosphingobium sp. 9]